MEFPRFQHGASDAPLKTLMFGPGNYFFLQSFRKVTEIIRVTGNSNDQAAMSLRRRLRFAQLRSRHDVELHVMAVHLEV